MLLTLPIRDVLVATPRARIVRVDLGDQDFHYLPGQAVLVCGHEQQTRRPYSLASPPEEADRERALELLVGTEATGSAAPNLPLEPGAMLDVEGPVGRFTFPEQPVERRFLFIAGGTGIAPLRAMLHRALNVPHEQVGVFYSARTPEEFAYEDELRAMAGAGRIEFRQTVTREPASQDWAGSRGRIGRDELVPLVHDPATLCFVCGPPALVDDMPKLLGSLGVPSHRIKIEEWG